MDVPDEDSMPPTLVQDVIPHYEEEPTLLVIPEEDSELSLTQRNSNRSNQDKQSQPFANLDTQQSGFDARTFDDDETGAVNFGHLSELNQPSSPVSVDEGFDNTRSGWRLQNGESQEFPGQTPFKSNTGFPETPALPRNPFAGQVDAAAPLGGTQLFGATQLLTSAVKHSPTSSRPSPNVLHNSISSNFLETSPLKNRTNVSSPPTLRTSSPNHHTDVPSTVVRTNRLPSLAEETPLARFAVQDEIIPESPLVRGNGVFQPSAHYESVNKSQQRKAPPVSILEDTDSDDDTIQMKRKRLADRKRAFGAEKLGRVSVERPLRRTSSEQPEVKRRRFNEATAEKTGTTAITASASDDATTKSRSNSIGQSQKQIPQSLEPPSLESTKATPKDDAGATVQGTQGTAENVYDDIIPATSPVQASPAIITQDDASGANQDLPPLPNDAAEAGDAEMETSSAPAPSRAVRRSRAAKQRRWIPSSSISAADPTPAVDIEPPHQLQDPLADVGTASDATAVPEGRGAAARTDNAEDGTSESSALSSLSATPDPESTPATKNSVRESSPTHSATNSPSIERSLRRRLLEGTSNPVSPRRATRFMTAVDRLRSEPVSEAESTSTSMTSDLSKSRSLHSIPRAAATAAVPRRKGRLFEGMVFAISLVIKEEKETHKDVKLMRDKLERKVEQAGGRVLQKGFHELLQTSPPAQSAAHKDVEALQFQPGAADYTFAAVITNGHSRSFKYMQALAFGIPCLPQQWLTACINHSQIVDWRPYLLCSGTSTVLGNTALSRWLPSYSAVDASLVETMKQRVRIMEGQTVLMVADTGKNTSPETVSSPAFLSQGLGAVVTKVATARQAKDALRRAEQTGQPFSWICVEHSTEKVGSLLPSARTGSKKKKQKQADTSLRLLHDELVIQSLILGRLVEPDEEKAL